MHSNAVPEVEATGREPGWRDLLWGANLLRSLALCGGVALHAINLYISTTILPSVVADIGGLDYYAWNTSLFVVASIIAAALASRSLAWLGTKAAYGLGAGIFVVGAVVCAAAPSMAVMLVGRFVQGLGGGLLLSLPYAMIRSVFSEPLWPRAMALISSMWGIATLAGPAVGGIFAELGIWRWAFGSLVPATVLFSLAAFVALPEAERRRGGEGGERARGRADDGDASADPIPAGQLALLAAAVLAASAGSVGSNPAWNVGCVLLAVALVLLLVRVETNATRRLLPRGALRRSSPLSVLYALSALLAVTVTCTEIFLPLFLQELHGRSPLEAGYIAALMSAGWTAAAVTGAGLRGRRLNLALRASPVLSLVSLATLVVILPRPGDGRWAELGPVCVALVAVGMAVGMAYPHLSARVLQVAPRDENELAASSIMTVQLSATALGAALAGLTVNLAGLAGGGGEMDVESAARWLFVVLLVAPVMCLWLMRSGGRLH